LRLIEILLIIVVPLIIFYLRSDWKQREITLNLIILPLIWYLFYAPIHELSHILGAILVGKEITDYRLFAHFWEGSFGFAYVEVRGGLATDIKSLIILVAPYILDVISFIAGYLILTKIRIENSFLLGLIFLFFCLRPLYDLIDNYIGIIYSHSDLVMVSEIIGSFTTLAFGIVSAFTGIAVTVSILFLSPASK
jgi:hypothetical protein